MRPVLPWKVWLGAMLATAWAANVFAQSGPSDQPAAEGGGDVSPPARAAWELRLFAGGGIGTRDLDLPRDGVVYQTRTGIFPAVDSAFALEHAPSADLRLALRARYRTSIGLQIAERHVGGSERTQHLRSHRLEVALAPSLHVDARGLWVLTASLGYGLSDLRPEAHLETPGYGLGGPFLRAELQLPLGTDRVRFRLGPEIQWIVQVGKELEHAGFASSGVGLGGTAALEILLSERWTVDATYSELRVWLDSTQPEALRDVSRWVTLRLSGAL